MCTYFFNCNLPFHMHNFGDTLFLTRSSERSTAARNNDIEILYVSECKLVHTKSRNITRRMLAPARPFRSVFTPPCPKVELPGTAAILIQDPVTRLHNRVITVIGRFCLSRIFINHKIVIIIKYCSIDHYYMFVQSGKQGLF